MEGGVHECARQVLRSFALFPAAESKGVINESSAELIHHGEKGAPILKFVLKNLVPKVNKQDRTGECEAKKVWSKFASED